MADQSRLTLSWSRLKQYEDCPQSVLRSMQGKRTPVKDGRMFLQGTVADRIMREWLEQEDPKPGGMLELLDKHLEQHAFNSDEYKIRWKGDPREDYAKVRKFVTEVVTNLEPILFDKVIPHGYEPELRFKTTVGVPYLDGRPVAIDLVGGIDITTMTLPEGPDSEYAIWDLKATANDAYVRGATLGQIYFYSIAIKSMFGKYPKEAGFITPACKEKVVTVDVTQAEIQKMMSRIIAYCHGVWRKEWQPKDKIDSQCDRCDVQHACDLFKLPQGKKVSFMELADKRRGRVKRKPATQEESE